MNRPVNTRLHSRARDTLDRLISIRANDPQVWSTFDQTTAETFIDLFARLEGGDKRILEIGSGHGFTCVLFASLGAKRLDGIEVVQSAVEYATRLRDSVANHLPVYFRQGTAAEPLPYPDESFDIILAIEVLSHIRANPAAVLTECARVLSPGGVLFISDGNNARSWFRRRQNYEIWRRFEQGPPTAPGESVHTHLIAEPYVAMRRRVARESGPNLTDDEVNRIADGTFQCTADEVRAAVADYVTSGVFPARVFKSRECPVEPTSGMYIEQLLDPFDLRATLRGLGFSRIDLAPRRRLPAVWIWSAFPAFTFSIANGFTVRAEKPCRQMSHLAAATTGR
jgi:SAM-dependent methyltransferase